MLRLLAFAFLSSAVLLSLADPAAAQSRNTTRKTPPAPPAARQDQEYRDCLARASRDAGEAFERALQWRARGGGAPARHCAAVALVNLGQPLDAAERLEQLASEGDAGPAATRAQILGQAGQAYIIADQPLQARAVLTEALRLAPDDPDLLIDRAQALAGAGDFWLAIDDLNRALERNPRLAEALVLRATAYRQVGSPELALDDADRALAVNPELAEAHLQRGIIFRQQGKKHEARQALAQVLVLAPEAEEGDAARDQIEKLELGLEDPPPKPSPRRTR